MGWITLKNGIYKYLPSATVQPRIIVMETLGRLKDGAKICDVGAGGRKITPETFTVDGFVTENTDLICDVHHIDLEDNSFDCVFSTGTLEHVKDPKLVLSEIIRITRPQGLVHIEVPFLQGFHADPYDYWRWTLEGLRLFCLNNNLDEVDSGVHIGPSSTVCWILNEYFSCLFGENIVGKIISTSLRIIFSPIKYLDYFLNRRKSAKNIASGFYFVGRKC